MLENSVGLKQEPPSQLALRTWRSISLALIPIASQHALCHGLEGLLLASFLGLLMALCPPGMCPSSPNVLKFYPFFRP